MDKANKIIRQVIIFFAIFIAVNFVFEKCQNPEEEISSNSGNVFFASTKDTFDRLKTVQVKIKNFTATEIKIANECPNEPFNVYRYENNLWIQKTAAPQIDCSNNQDIAIAPGKEFIVAYENWNHALFYETGRYKIEFSTTINGEEKNITSNEFIVKKEGILKQLWYGIFYRPIYNLLIFLTNILPGHSLGFAIIILTIIIRTILLIPNNKALKSQKKLQDIQPRLEKIKEKHKGDQQRIAVETMAIWKEAKINPFSSCLPLLLQFPFLIALFYVVKSGLNPDNSFMMYTSYANFSLSDIGVIFLNILDLTKAEVYFLPLIVGGLQFVQMKIAAPKGQKKENQNEMAMATNMMTYILPVMIALFTASLPAGVGLYWGTSTLYGIIQQQIVTRTNKTSDTESEPTVRVIEKN